MADDPGLAARRDDPPRRLSIAFIGARGVIGTYSGIETYYEEVGSRLAARGHRVVAYCRSYFTPPVAEHRGIEVRRLPSLRGKKHLETVSHSLLATLDCLPRRFDVVQYHAIGSAPLAWVPRLVGATTVVSVRGLDWRRAKWGGVARAVLRFGEWASARAPNATAVVSSTLADHYARVHDRQVETILNAVPPAERAPLERLRAHGLEGDDFVLYAGRLSPEKHVDTLIEAFRALEPRETLVIAGGSSQTDAYVQHLRALADGDGAPGPRILFLGRVDRDWMRELLTHCRAYVLASAMEGLSVGLLEAVAYGAAIVASDIPENREVVGDAALLVPPGDVDALAGALAELLGPESEARRVELRRRAVARAAAWPDWDEVARRTEALYWRLIDPSLIDPSLVGATDDGD